MSTPYAGTNNTWHAEITRIEDNDLATGDVASLPDRENKDNANYLYQRAIVATHHASSTPGAGSWEPSIAETQRVVAILVRICGGGENGTDGGASVGGRGGRGGGYAERYISGSDLDLPGVINYSVGAGGDLNAEDGGHTWVDLEAYGAVVAKGGTGSEDQLTIVTTNYTIRSPFTDLTNYPPSQGWGSVHGGDGGDSGAGDDGGAGHFPGGAGGSSGGSRGRAGTGWGAGGGGGHNETGDAAGGGGGGGGWFLATDNAADGVEDEGGRGADGRVEITIWHELAV